MSTSDQQVVERVRAGDTEAFSDLVARHQKAAFGIAVSTTADLDEAEDLVQICFVEAFSRLGELRDGCRFGPWLYSIARNRCRNWLRDRSRLPTPASGPSGLRSADDLGLPTNPEQDVLGPAWSDAIGLAMAALPREYRDIVILRYVGDLSYEEIGQLLSLNASTARSRCWRARDMMRESSCKQIEELIQKRLDDELTIDEEERLEQHLAICPDCRDRWQQAEALVRDLRATYQPSDVLAERVMSAVRTAVFCARRAAHLGDEQAASTYRELARRAGEKAEALACEERPELYLLLGSEYYLPRQEWEPMKQAFQRALELDPAGSASAVLWGGLLAWETGGEAEGVEVMAMLLAIEPEAIGTFWASFAAASVDEFERIRVNVPGSGLDRAHELLTPLVGRLQDGSFVRTALAATHLHKGRVEEAVSELEAAGSGAAAGTAAWWQVKAQAEEAHGNPKGAVEAAIRTLEVMDPQWWWEPFRVDQILGRLDPAAGARAHERKVAEGGFSHAILQRLLRAAGDMEGAERVLKEAQKYFAGWPSGAFATWWTLHSLFEFYWEHGRLLEAGEAARRRLEVCPPGHPFHAYGHACTAAFAAALGQWEEAVARACVALRALEGAQWGWEAVERSPRILCDAVQHGATAQQTARMREAFLRCLELIDRGAVEARPAAEEVVWAAVGRFGGSGEPEEQVDYWLRILGLKGGAPVTRRARVEAALSLSSLAPDEARQRFEGMAAEDPTSDLPWLGLYWAHKESDAEAALDAAIEAIGRASAEADPEAYRDLADFLARTDPARGRKALCDRAVETDQQGGALAIGLARLAVALDDWDQLRSTVDALLQGEDVCLTALAAEVLSGLGRHTEAIALMEHAIRLDPAGAVPWSWTLHLRAWDVFRAAGAESRLPVLYEQAAAADNRLPVLDGGEPLRPVCDAWLARNTAELWWRTGDRPKCREWLERAGAIALGLAHYPEPCGWLHLDWARLYEAEGYLEEARRSYQRALELLAEWRDRLAFDPRGTREALDQASVTLVAMESLADAAEPVATLCDWVREELRPEAAGQVLEAALAASEAGRAPAAVAEGLHALVEEAPDRVLEWARRLADHHTRNIAAMLAREVLQSSLRGSEDWIAKGLEQTIRTAPSWGEPVGAAATYFVENDPQAGLAALQPLLERSPEDAEVHRDLGRLLEAAGELERAEAEYLKAAELSGWRDGSIIAFHAQHGRAEQAVAAADRALGAHPEGSAGHAYLTLAKGEALKSLGIVEEAATAALEAVAAARRPDAEERADVFLRCGQLLLGLDLVPPAADALRRTLELPNTRRSESAEAEAGLKAAAERALALHPEGIASHADALCEDAEKLRAAGDQHEAIECARVVSAYAHLERSARPSAVALRAARVLQEAGESEEAARACLMAMERWAGPPARDLAVEIAQAVGDEGGDSVRPAVEEVLRLARTWDDTLKGAMGYLLDADPGAYRDLANLLPRTGPQAGEATFGDRLGKTRWPDPRLTMALIWLAAEVEDWDEVQSVVDVLLESNDAELLQQASGFLSDLGRRGEAAALRERAASLGSGGGAPGE